MQAQTGAKTVTQTPAQIVTQAPAQPQAATQSSPADQPVYTLQANSRLILTDVTVSDRNGSPVHNLPSSAFHVFDGNKPQEIASFEEHTGQTPAPVPDTAASPRAKGVYSNDFLLHAPPVLNIIVLDITNLELEDQMYLSYELAKYLNNVPAGEMLAVYERGGPVSVLLQPFTADKGLLLAAVHRGLPRFPPRGAIYMSDFDTLQQIAKYLADLPGRKNVLWFSGGSTLYLNPDPTQYQEIAPMRRVYDVLEAGRIAVYPIDARGLTVAFGSRATIQSFQHGRMSEVAEATGGRAFYNNNGLHQAAARITSTGGDFYSLTYSPRGYKEDKKWHKVRVALDLPGYTLSYRRGYFADGINAQPRSRRSLTRQLADGSTGTAQASPLTTPIVFQARVLPTSDPANILPATKLTRADPEPKLKRGAIPYSIEYSVPADSLTVRAAADGKKVMNVVVAAFAFSQEGLVIDQHVQRMILNLNEENFRRNPHVDVPLDMHLQLTKGEVYLMLAVVDEGSGRSGNLQISMQVPASGKLEK